MFSVMKAYIEFFCFGVNYSINAANNLINAANNLSHGETVDICDSLYCINRKPHTLKICNTKYFCKTKFHSYFCGEGGNICDVAMCTY